MKKILIICGSMRKNGTGYSLLKGLLANRGSGQFDYKFLFLSDYEIKPCIGCSLCFKKDASYCPLKDDVSRVVEMMVEADGIIFLSPVYERGVSGHMKSFFDRTCYLIHKPLIYNKSFISISTADAGGNINNWFKVIGESMGMKFIASFSVLAIKYKNNDKYRQKLRDKISLSLNKLEKYIAKGETNVKFKNLIRFNFWKVKTKLFKEVYKGDYDYWREQGFFKRDYYTEVNLNLLQKIIVSVISTIAPHLIKKRVGLRD